MGSFKELFMSGIEKFNCTVVGNRTVNRRYLLSLVLQRHLYRLYTVLIPYLNRKIYGAHAKKYPNYLRYSGWISLPFPSSNLYILRDRGETAKCRLHRM